MIRKCNPIKSISVPKYGSVIVVRGKISLKTKRPLLHYCPLLQERIKNLPPKDKKLEREQLQTEYVGEPVLFLFVYQLAIHVIFAVLFVEVEDRVIYCEEKSYLNITKTKNCLKAQMIHF